MASVPKIRQECLDLVRANYRKTTKNNSDLFNPKIMKSDDPQYIYKQILKVKEIKAERKAKLAQAHKDFS